MWQGVDDGWVATTQLGKYLVEAIDKPEFPSRKIAGSAASAARGAPVGVRRYLRLMPAQ
jgi:hypothetical protein